MDPTAQPIFYSIGDSWHVVRVLVRLALAGALGAVMGFERQEEGKAAGLRTHILVALGAAAFVIAPLEAGTSFEHLTRVIQGLTTGIGFLGAGTILKLTDERRIQGLTTAASIWLTAAAGTAAGMGMFWTAVLSVALGWTVVVVIGRMERWINPRDRGRG